MGIGSRETYIPALKDHSIDLVPEYIGNLLLYFAAAVQRHHAGCRRAGALPTAARRPVDSDAVAGRPTPIRSPSPDDTASQWNLKTIADLAAHSAEVKFAAPSAFETRPAGLPGLQAEVRTRHQAGQLRRHQRRRWCGHRARVGRGKGQRRQHLQHFAGHPAEPFGGPRRSRAQFSGRKHCAACEFAEEVRPAQRCAGRGVSEADHLAVSPSSTPRCRATRASILTRRRETGCRTTASTTRSEDDG